MSPQRIQRRRFAGWRKPEGTIYVGRGSKWGNPFRVGRACVAEFDLGGGRTFKVEHGKLSAETAVEWYRKLVTTGFSTILFGSLVHEFSAEELDEIAGKDLMCWCPLDRPCRADVLLELANRAKP